MLSCPVRAGVVCPDGPACCRLAGFHRRRRTRSARYPSDTTDGQWAVIDPLLPDPASLTGDGGRPEEWCRRDIVDAIFYLVDNGCKWRALPADFPPWSTVYNYLAGWERHGITQDVLDGLRDRVRLAEGRTAAPSAGVVDSQSVKAAETVGRASRGYDAGKKQRPQTAHRRGHPRPAAVCPGHRGLGAGPRRRPPAAGTPDGIVSPPDPTDLGRRRLRRQTCRLGQ